MKKTIYFIIGLILVYVCFVYCYQSWKTQVKEDFWEDPAYKIAIDDFIEAIKKEN